MATKTWEFTQSLNVDGKAYAAGDTVAEADIPPGTFTSLKRLKQIKEHVEVPPDLVPPPPVATQPASVGKPVAHPLPINPPVHAPAHPPAHTPPHAAPHHAPAHTKDKDADEDEPHKNPKRK